MTLGQRIAQNRKEQGLSQEALGDRLGVSRQSIYKWESDSALPEIDKLIALSRLFGVSVGWLLGLEEDAAPTLEASGELTETQLKMVEEIVDRYIAALPKPKPRRRWPWVLAAVALLFVGWNLFQRLDRMDRQYNNLQNSVNNVTYSVNSQIGSISDRVEEILKSQNNLTADYSTEIDNINPQVGRVTFSVYAVPKTYVEGMRVEFLADYGGAEPVSGGCYQHDERFSGEIKCPLTDHITLSALFIYPDGTRQTQLLDTYEFLYTESLPSVELQDSQLMFAEAPGGVLTLSDCYIMVRQDDDSPAAINELQVGLFKNRKLLAWGTPCEQPSNCRGFADWAFYRMPDMTVALTGEDELEAAALVTDEYGRQTVISEVPSYVLDEEDQNLTWASSYEVDTDPSHWQFD